MIERTYQIPDNINPLIIYGHQDTNLSLIEDYFDVRLIARGNALKIIGGEDEVAMVQSLLAELVHISEKQNFITREDLETAIHILKPADSTPSSADQTTKTPSWSEPEILISNDGPIRPKSEGQNGLINAIRENDIVFSIGPAGTGKTYLSVAMAVAYLKSQKMRKIILARPAVEAGESLGYLPGDFKEKIDPYLKPLYDALEDMLPKELIKKYLDLEVIEILPLAYMRGRTLNNAFVILDEAQNSTFTQMKMFLTRLGFNSKAVITGDITQVDLPKNKESGLVSSLEVLKDIEGIAFIRLGKADVVRHKLVKNIIDAYNRYDNSD